MRKRKAGTGVAVRMYNECNDWGAVYAGDATPRGTGRGTEGATPNELRAAVVERSMIHLKADRPELFAYLEARHRDPEDRRPSEYEMARRFGMATVTFRAHCSRAYDILYSLIRRDAPDFFK